jgi:hypothetical protein
LYGMVSSFSKLNPDRSKICSIDHAGDHMLFFVLNVVQCIGLVMTFKPFLAVPEHYDLK